MNGETVFLIILAVAIVLVIQYLIAKEFYNVAVSKGYTAKKYLWLSFLLGMVGYLLVIALPDRVDNKKMANDELPDL